MLLKIISRKYLWGSFNKMKYNFLRKKILNGKTRNK